MWVEIERERGRGPVTIQGEKVGEGLTIEEARELAARVAAAASTTPGDEWKESEVERQRRLS